MIDFEDRAKFHKSFLNSSDFDMVVMVEDVEDAIFWEDVFIQNGLKRNPQFIPYTREIFPDGTTNDRRGKDTVLQYLSYSDKRLALCIDSDYDLLTKTNNPTIQDNVFQTYTHSIENYKSYAPSLMNLCLEATHSTDNQLFDIEKFLSDYSEIVYPLFVVFIISESEMNGIAPFLTSEKFSETIILGSRFNIQNNGKGELDKLQDKVNDLLHILHPNYSDALFKSTENHIRQLGIAPSNTYLFVRGHDLYESVILPILRSVTRILQGDKIKTTPTNKIQPYIDSCKDIAKLLKQNKNHHSCPLMNKIQTDIAAF